MRIVLQRVSQARVVVDGETVGAIGRGVLLLVGVEKGDTQAEVDVLVGKLVRLRIFPGRTPMDRSLADIEGACLVVSQFTLAGTLRKGNRPGFDRAEDPVRATPLYEAVAAGLRAAGLRVETGRFGAMMDVELVNAGPVTFVLDARAGKLC